MKFKNQSIAHPDWPYTCDQFCKVHWYWDFDSERHEQFPNAWNVKSQAGWRSQVVWCGPPGYYPRKPNDSEWNQIRMSCPHEQMDLTCNTCLRHTFRPMPV